MIEDSTRAKEAVSLLTDGTGGGGCFVLTAVTRSAKMNIALQTDITTFFSTAAGSARRVETSVASPSGDLVLFPVMKTLYRFGTDSLSALPFPSCLSQVLVAFCAPRLGVLDANIFESEHNGAFTLLARDGVLANVTFIANWETHTTHWPLTLYFLVRRMQLCSSEKKQVSDPAPKNNLAASTNVMHEASEGVKDPTDESAEVLGLPADF